MGAAGSNWAGNLDYSARMLAAPRSIPELQELIASAEPGSLKALGTRHSFNDVADTDGTAVSTASLQDGPAVAIDADRGVVAVASGVRYGELALELDAAGLALGNLASLPHISVGGAVATGTHGSGERNGSLAAAVAAVEFVDGRGEHVRLARGDAGFDGAVVSLGVLGITTRLELDVEPSFELAQHVYRELPLEALVAHFDEIVGAGYSVSVFSTWQREGVADQVWLKRRVDRDPAAPAELFGARPADAPQHPIPGVSAVHCTPQLGVPGPWFQRLPHFLLEFRPSNGDELQSEYLVPRARALDALAALRRLAPRIAPLLLVNEIREVAADALWLSGSFETDVVAFHFTWQPRQAEVDALLPAIEAELLPLGARPHWGKRFAADASALEGRYSHWRDFAELRAEHDPRGVFANAFTRRVLGG
ncbi:FAD-binding protein [Agromyces seonyuensis]|uniref:FAD-binding protein n=1 Tax=Agromyces seonyuensis TaxID=2662446 RepID=A0A6I4P8N8_9MICO|nr:FAD-binding protein [Agromyces seonyuensis]MWC00328.1 FAD-binding protein [Agromyces seonyuensis]